MTIASMTKVSAKGGGMSPLLRVYAEFAGDGAYLTGGTRGIKALVREAAGNYGLKPVEFEMSDCGVYDVRGVQERGYVETDNLWPVANQIGLTIFVKVNGAAADTILFAGGVTTAAHVVGEINAQIPTKVLAFAHGTQVRVMSLKQGDGSSVEIVAGGTCTDITWDDAVDGTDDMMLLVRTANNVEAAEAANLSGQTFRGWFLCE